MSVCHCLHTDMHTRVYVHTKTREGIGSPSTEVIMSSCPACVLRTKLGSSRRPESTQTC